MKKLVCIVLAMVIMLSATAMADSLLKLMQAKQIDGSDNVRLYVNAVEMPSQDNTSVFMNSAKLDNPLEIQPVSETGQGTVYVFCLDVSGTIDSKDLDAACDELVRFCANLGERDLMRVYVIGSGATPLCDYTRDVDVVSRALNDMPRRTNKTFLWEAVRIAADDLSTNRANLPELAQIIVFSDGVDDSDQTGSVEQTLESVQQAGMPLRVVLMNSKEKNADLSLIEWLCEKSGGVIFDGRDGFASGLDQLHNEMANDYCITVADLPYERLSGNAEWFVQQRIGKEMHASNIMSSELSQEGVPAPTPVPVHSVNYTYTGEAPEGAPELPSPNICSFGNTVEVAAEPRMEGYTFSGWDITGSFAMPDSDVTISGSWTPNRHRVVYSYAGTVPKDVPALPTAEEYSFGETVVVASSPEMAGYTFSGWGIEEFVMPDSDVFVSGMWIANRHRVRYSYTGEIPAGLPALPETGTYNFNDTVHVAEAPSVEGYTFRGWSVEGVDLSSDSFVMPDEDVTFTGSWSVNEHQVRYAYTGTVPTDAPEPVEAMVYGFGETVAVAEIPEMKGYTFGGWSTEDVDLSGDGFVMPDNDVTFTGSWTINSHDVSYIYDESAPEAAQETTGERHNYGERVLLPAPIIEGYAFNGWTAEGIEIDENGLFEMPDEDVTVTGSWNVNRHSVRYKYTGKTPAEAPSAPQAAEYDYGETVILPAPEMENYTFSGWSAEGTELSGDSFVMPDNDVTISGNWTPVPLSGAHWMKSDKELSGEETLSVVEDELELHLNIDGAIRDIHFSAVDSERHDVTDSLISQSDEEPGSITIHRNAMLPEYVYTITGSVYGVSAETPEVSIPLTATMGKKKNLLPFIAIGVGLLGLLVLFIVVLTRRKKNDVTSVTTEEDFMEKTSVTAPESEQAYHKHVVRRVSYIETVGEEDSRECAQVITDSAIIGRDSDCDIFYKGDSRAEQTLSHKQAKFTLDSAGHLFIEPYPGTRNPTYVNEQEIDGATPVEPNDVIRMGDVSIEVKSIDQVEKN